MFVANITIIPLVMAQAMLCETVGDDTHDTDTGIPDTGVPGTSQTKGKLNSMFYWMRRKERLTTGYNQ